MAPVRFNSPGPIQTIQREVRNRLQNEFHFSGFTGEEFDDDCSLTTSYPIDAEWSRFSMGVQLVRLYLSDYGILHTGASGIKTHPFLVQLAKIRGAKHVHTHHTTTPKDYEQQKWLANHAGTVTTVSPFVARWAQDEFGVSVDSVIPNGVDLEQFSPGKANTEQDLVLFVGRLINRKNPVLVIELAEIHSDVTFAIRGNGSLQSKLEKRAPSNVRFIERLPIDELAELYSRASVALCPYEKEGFGMVVLESMAAGTPVIGLDSGNLSDLITKNSGVLCSSLDISKWNQALLNVRDSNREFDPRSRATEFPWDSTATGYRDLYRNLASESNVSE
jgi:glycosyltransferase involved in cell wall biosynthesis